MANLTEQWNNGTLVNGKKYFCRTANGVDIFEFLFIKIDKINCWWCLENKRYCYNNEYHAEEIEVLAEVPTYEELQRLKKGWELYSHETVITKQLRQLLKECLIALETYAAEDETCGLEEDNKLAKNILPKIREVLK